MKAKMYTKPHPIYIGNKTIGFNEPCFIIAEAGISHGGDPETAVSLVDIAVSAGADAVKFHSFIADDLSNPGSYRDSIKQYELSSDFYKTLHHYCIKQGIIFLSTPYTIQSLDVLDPLVPAYKIASGDINNTPFLEAVARRDKPIILSTGMSYFSEVKSALETIRNINPVAEVIILHCTSQYPCPPSDVNLRAMMTLRDNFNCLVGYSDHTVGIEASLLARAMGASVIEKHFTTLDALPDSPDYETSLLPIALADLVSEIRRVESVLGSDIKQPTSHELVNQSIFRKSLVAKRDIPPNSIISRDDIVIKRPGSGISPDLIRLLIGSKSSKFIKKDSLFTPQEK